MIIEKKYKVSWKHYNKDNDVKLTEEQLGAKVLDLIDQSNSRAATKEAISSLFKNNIPQYDKSHSNCIIEELEEETNQWKTISVGISIVHPDDNFNRKKGILESFKDAVSNIGTPNITKEEKESWSEEQIEEEKHNRYIRGLLWQGFWKEREVKPTTITLFTERDRNLRIFLDETCSKQIRGKHIIYTIQERTEIYFPRND